ncbi:MAG: hypothetical protein WCS42_12790 [Verrucomicrobiota bacterium]
MNISDNERFHELAHKALAKQATPTEQRELGAMIAENPKLKEAMEQMGGEAELLRELLPMLEDLQHPMPDIPPPPMELLRSEVGKVFESRKKTKAELGELLARLEKWARQQAGTSRDEVMAMVNVLRSSFLGEATEDLMADVAMLRSTTIACAAPTIMEGAETYARADESMRRHAEVEDRLRSIDQRLRRSEEISRECREEMRRLLEFMAQEKESGAKRRGQQPVPKLKK